MTSIFLSFGDASYIYRFSYMKYESRLFESNLHIVSFDEPTHVWCEQHNVTSVSPIGNTVEEKIYFSKVSYPLRLLLLGHVVYVSEMDVFWLSKPYLPTLDWKILIAKHRYNKEVNIGFMRFIPSYQSIHMLHNIQHWLSRPHHIDRTCGAFDQKVFDLAIRGPVQDNAFINRTFRGKTPECHLPKIEVLSIVPKMKLKWAYIPVKTLDHWPLNSIKSPGVHIWTEMGPPTERIKWFMTHKKKDNKHSET